MRFQGAIAAVVCCVLAGCARTEQLPPYDWHGTPSALSDLAARAASVRTIQSQGTMTLTKPDGDSVSFDVALLAAPPERLRLRAWKFGHAAFDLTMTPEGLWVWTSQEARDHEPDLGTRLSARGFADAWSVFAGSFFESANSRVSAESADLLRIESASGTSRIACEIRKSTLTARRFEFFDETGSRRATLSLADYQLCGPTPWPSLIRAESDNATILLELDDTVINTELPEGAFAHPAGAVKQP